MFLKGSRYRGLAESSPIDADGERLRGKDLRLIPRAPDWPFRHTVREGDRLDLLSFKYYTEPTRWWQIADANPQELFPTDLLDPRPLVKESFVLRNLSFETRVRDLVLALSAVGQVTTPIVTSFDAQKPLEPDFVETTVVVTYPPAVGTHQAIVDAIQAVNIGFQFVRAFAWPAGPDIAEGFTFGDPTTRDKWRSLIATLEAIGVLELKSNMLEGVLDLTYNTAVTPRESLLTVFNRNSFVLQPETTAFTAVGSPIVVPPNQAG